MRRLRSDDSGFTLIELVIAMVVSALVALAVGAAFEVDLVSTRDDQRAVSSSQDAAATASLFARDVQSAASVSTTSAACGSTGLVVSLSWTQPLPQQVDYAYSGGQLTRVRCGTVSDAVVVASQLTVAPLLTCTTSPCSGSAGLTLTLSEADGTSYPLTAYRRAALS